MTSLEKSFKAGQTEQLCFSEFFRKRLQGVPIAFEKCHLADEFAMNIKTLSILNDKKVRSYNIRRNTI